MPSDEAELQSFFVDVFGSADVDGTGRLHVDELNDLLERADLGLSTIQRTAILAEAVVDDDGMVEYEQFARDAATIIAAIIDLQINEARAVAVVESRGNTVMGMSEAEFCDALVDSLGRSDTTGSGMVHYSDATAALVSDLGLSTKQANGVVRFARADSEGNVSITDVAAGAFAVMRAMEEHRRLAEGSL